MVNYTDSSPQKERNSICVQS